MSDTAVGSVTKLPLLTKIAHGFGATAYGLKDGGFSYFLMIFYTTVVGLEPALAGLAILCALVFDAINDPIVGYWSDNTRSRFGRRHPFMYAAAIPVAVTYFLLWNPPELTQTGLFFYLLCIAVLIRTLITFYETPSSALMPELTNDYDERTSIQAWRLFFAWAGGTMMTVFVFGVLLVPTEEYTIGTLNREGYARYGVIASVVMLLSILVSTASTHHRIPQLRQPERAERRSIGRVYREVFETLSERSFLALFFAMLFAAVATGLTAALSFLMLTYFWEFSSEQIFLWTALVVVSSVIGLIVAPRLTKRLGKKRSVLVLGAVAFTIAPLPVILRLLGWFPENGDPLTFILVASINTFDLGLIIALQAISSSMVGDLVDQSELKTGRRSEGVFFAAITFVRKSNQGIGAFLAGIILQVVGLPARATPDEVSPEVIWNLGAWLVPSQYFLWTLLLVAMSRYGIDRDQHEANLKDLAAK